ncbi:hypothetical protein AA80_00885 [Petrotoga sibirica DSM 13575]|uniref:Uncharacterized protein n=1 Tax=Petrotoga sibirica DSM 13575 TaxID=1122956 RepID=A0A855MRM7_9BACT|nr:MAG: Uncharacterized protein XD96_0103 [Petrotoga mobilis]POZ89387.1 hypothetical protein AA80_00885 [Petrotoga sibirica DSM 13575]POZ91748.1 hypothetical protein AD60_00890 [Petrotoga sp. SL27]
MNLNIKNPLIKTAFLVIFFYLLFLISRYLRIAPTVVSLILPLGAFFLEKRYAFIFSISIFFLIFISGFVVEANGIFLLFFLPILSFIVIEKWLLKHIFITSLSILAFYLMYTFFGELLPDSVTRGKGLFLIILLYLFFTNVYGYLLKRLKYEISSLLDNFFQKENY